MAGREARGERWRFASLAHELRLVRGERLEYLERFRVGEDAAPRGAWLAAGASYFGSMLVSGGADVTAERAEAIHAGLQDSADVRAAADLIAERLLLVRLMSREGAAFHRARRALGASIDACDHAATAPRRRVTVNAEG
jgi:urease accessory protein UreH